MEIQKIGNKPLDKTHLVEVELSILSMTKKIDSKIASRIKGYFDIKTASFGCRDNQEIIILNPNTSKAKKLIPLSKGAFKTDGMLLSGEWTKKKTRANTILERCCSYETESLTLAPQKSKSHTNYRIFSLKILRISNSVHRVLALKNFKISKKDFQILIQRASKLNSLQLGSCDIDSEGCNFDTKTKYKLKNLSFEYSGHITCSNWIRYTSKMEAILEAISKCGLKDSLKNIDLSWNSMTNDQIKGKAEDLGLTDMKISGLNFLGCMRYCVKIQK